MPACSHVLATVTTFKCTKFIPFSSSSSIFIIIRAFLPFYPLHYSVLLLNRPISAIFIPFHSNISSINTFSYVTKKLSATQVEWRKQRKISQKVKITFLVLYYSELSKLLFVLIRTSCNAILLLLRSTNRHCYESNTGIFVKFCAKNEHIGYSHGICRVYISSRTRLKQQNNQRDIPNKPNTQRQLFYRHKMPQMIRNRTHRFSQLVSVEQFSRCIFAFLKICKFQLIETFPLNKQKRTIRNGISRLKILDACKNTSSGRYEHFFVIFALWYFGIFFYIICIP